MSGDDLSAVPMLAALPEPKLRELSRACPVRRYDAGTVLARHGERAGHLVVVHAGQLAAIQESVDGERIRFGTFDGPCVIDKAAVLSGAEYDASWVAETPCRARRFAAGTFARLLAEEPPLREHVLRYLAAQVVRERRDRARREVAPMFRVAAWLAETAARQGPRVVLPGAQQGLGERLGLSRITVNRVLQTLAKEGLVRVEPGTVCVLDHAAVSQMVTVHRAGPMT